MNRKAWKHFTKSLKKLWLALLFQGTSLPCIRNSFKSRKHWSTFWQQNDLLLLREPSQTLLQQIRIPLILLQNCALRFDRGFNTFVIENEYCSNATHKAKHTYLCSLCYRESYVRPGVCGSMCVSCSNTKKIPNRFPIAHVYVRSNVRNCHAPTFFLMVMHKIGISTRCRYSRTIEMS